MVEAIVLSASSVKLRWTISYSYERELIDGFFIGYRSFDSSALLVEAPGLEQPLAGNAIQAEGSLSGAGTRPTAKQVVERPTFTYKTIRLINQHQQQQQQQASPDEIAQGPQAAANALSQGSEAAPVVAPISSVTKTVPASATAGPSRHLVGAAAESLNGAGHQPRPGELTLVVVSNFEFTINGLERNTEYTILIQCFNKKGTGPSSDPVVTKTLQHDPPAKLALAASELAETSLRLSWRFPSELMSTGQRDYPQHSPLGARPGQSSTEPVDGFVLTFAKIAQPSANSSRPMIGGKRQQEPSSVAPVSLPHYNPHQSRDYQQQQQQQADSAARISKQNGVATNNNFQYTPPIQPSQLLDHQWQAVQLAPQQREHVLKNLECGTWYAMKIWAFNKVGKGEPSDLVTVSTRGRAPVAPSRAAFLAANSSQVKLKLNAWYDGGCEIDKFVVQYRARGQLEWTLVSNNILREQGDLIIRDLSPATAYELLVGARNQVNLSEAKYRFTTLDSEGKQVAPSRSSSSSSFLPTLNDDYNDETMVDYSDDGQYSGAGPSVRRESMGGADLSHSHSNGQRWLMLAGHVLNSPLTLLFTFCIFLVLLALLAFHRFSGAAESGHYHDGAASPTKTNLHRRDDHGNGQQSSGRRCSIDETATMLEGAGGPPMSCTTNESSASSTDSPGRMVNVHAASLGRAMNPAHLSTGAAYGPLDCYRSGTYCNAASNQATTAYAGLSAGANSEHLDGGHQYGGQQKPVANWTGRGLDNYSPGPQHASQQLVGFYSALPNANYGLEAASLNGAATPAAAGLEHDAGHQHLMQMLLIPPAPHQQAAGQQHEDYPASMTTLALATLARQKVGLLKQPNGAADYNNNSLLQHGPSFTLGRAPAQNQECFHAGEQQLSSQT